jgi:hypothetical protein
MHTDSLHYHLVEKPPEHYDMEDEIIPAGENGPDNPAIRHEPLAGAIEFLNTDLRSFYLTTDQRALEHQAHHRQIAKWAISLGFTAILLAIIQFCLLSLAFEMKIPFLGVDVIEIFRITEMIAILFATIAVIAGLYRSHQNLWLINRHIAERCRLLKFKSLLEPALWNPAEFQDWQNGVRTETGNMKEILRDEIHEISVQSAFTDFYHKINQILLNKKTTTTECIDLWINTPSTSPPDLFDAPGIPADIKKEFLEYYRKKRLFYQRDYYFRRYMEFREQNERLEKLPTWLFFASVFAVLLHFISDVWGKGEGGHVASIVFIGVAVTLPVAGYVLKTYRDTFQTSKSSALYYAKFSALEKLNNQLSGYENSVDENWRQILEILHLCENFLDSEHREWLILIRDAEWFL